MTESCLQVRLSDDADPSRRDAAISIIAEIIAGIDVDPQVDNHRGVYGD